MSNYEEHIHVKPELFSKEGILEIRRGEMKIFQSPGANYLLESIGAVINLIKSKGSKEHTVIFYNNDSVRVILDDSIMDRPQDKGTYRYAFSEDFLEWENIFGRQLAQKEFVDFLRRRPEGQVGDIEWLLANIQKLKLVTEIVEDYQYDDNNNITFMFKSKDGEGNVKLPSVIIATIPLLNESDLIIPLEVELELRKPKSENEKPGFVLTCPKLSRYIREATDHEVEKMKEALDGYLIMAGSI